jgi:transcriptional regulator GlxA family with amidase domain
MSREISWLMLVVNHRFGHNVADEVLRQRLVVRMRIAHDEPPTPGRRVTPAV